MIPSRFRTPPFTPLLLTAVAFAFFIGSVHAGQFLVTKVYDGDTIRAEGHDVHIVVRLVGIDAPEVSRKTADSGQPFGRDAKRVLSEMVLNKPVDIRGYGTDRYNRILGVVQLGGKNINLEMVRMGLAEVYRGKPPKMLDISSYRQVEKDARESRRGMWVQKDAYASPKAWRKNKKG